jgi:hypothetical protein
LCQASIFACRVVALRQQGRVLGRETGEYPGDASPEGGRVETGAGQDLVLDEGGQGGRDLKARLVDHLFHGRRIDRPGHAR